MFCGLRRYDEDTESWHFYTRKEGLAKLWLDGLVSTMTAYGRRMDGAAAYPIMIKKLSMG